MIESLYCPCGQPIYVEKDARTTYRSDGLRFFEPDEKHDGACLFRCPTCTEVVEYEKLVKLGKLPITKETKLKRVKKILSAWQQEIDRPVPCKGAGTLKTRLR